MVEPTNAPPPTPSATLAALMASPLFAQPNPEPANADAASVREGNTLIKDGGASGADLKSAWLKASLAEV